MSDVTRMNKKRKKYLDDLWIHTDMGKWLQCRAKEDDTGARRILEKLFDMGYIIPIDYIMEEGKRAYNAVKEALTDVNEGKEYILELEKRNPEWIEVMIAYEIPLMELYDDAEVLLND